MLLTRRIISSADFDRLSAALDKARNSWLTYAPYLDLFRSELRRSRVVPEAQVPPDVITVNSRFALTDPRTEQTVAYTLVYPELETPQLGRLSVLSPMGAALLGARIGDEVCWHSADGPQVARVQRLIYQPESSGDQN
jgi:regulator of nucleoside diphosphate kinase